MGGSTFQKFVFLQPTDIIDICLIRSYTIYKLPIVNFYFVGCKHQGEAATTFAGHFLTASVPPTSSKCCFICAIETRQHSNVCIIMLLGYN